MASKGRARPSQLDVANLAGVSRTTVSLVINDVPETSISAPTRERVWAAVEKLGFRPNEMARGLRASKSNVLGLITNDIATTPYAVAIIKGAQDCAFEVGKTLLIIDSEGADAATKNAILKMNDWQVEGLAFAADYHREISVPDGLPDMPYVLVDCYSSKEDVISIVPDERQGGRLATETLIRAGHQRIGFINGPRGYRASSGRLQGYRDAHRSAGLAVDRALIRSGDWWQESAARHAAQLLDLADPPTALFCANDWMAMGAYDVIKDRGLTIPDDIAVVGFDNRVEIAAHMRPGLTTVALPYYEMGRRAINALLDPTAPTGQALLPCPLVHRQSV
jgi:LacI family transcriptional regulator